MKIKVAKHIGFCFGVRRAVNIAEDALNKGGRFFCLGPIIHNPQEVKRLYKKGLRIVNNVNVLSKGDTLIIRSHGLLPELIKFAKGHGIQLIDATCPFVKKAQNICTMLKKEGFDVIVVGDKHHPEVKALVGFAGGEAFVVENTRDIENLKFKNKKIGVLAQTTQSRQNFQELGAILLKKCNNKAEFDQIRVFNTICADSAARQINAKEISSSCDAILVIGGKDSANSRRLANICKRSVPHTHHIEVAGDINPRWSRKDDCVGIVSGASTPDWIIKDVISKLKAIDSKKK
jgi:4-hydroxy-3-methylbut-2-enyl diphosphate reductase